MLVVCGIRCQLERLNSRVNRTAVEIVGLLLRVHIETSSPSPHLTEAQVSGWLHDQLQSLA